MAGLKRKEEEAGRRRKRRRRKKPGVAQACNPSYSGGRDQEDPSLRPAQARTLQGPLQPVAGCKAQTEESWSSQACRPGHKMRLIFKINI
jgi:hypothetical protein